MKEVTLHIPDSNYPFFMELAKNLHFIKKIEVADEPTKEQILQNIKVGLQEVKSFKKESLKLQRLPFFYQTKNPPCIQPATERIF